MKIEKRPILPLVLITLLSTIFLASISGVAKAQTTPHIAISPSSYTYIANFTTPPSLLTFNITATDVTELGTWQTTIGWDPILLSYNSSTTPTDNIFGTKQVVATSDSSAPGTLIIGSALLHPETDNVTGSGTLFNLSLNVLDVAAAGFTNVTFTGITTDTFLLKADGTDEPFTHTGSSYSNVFLVGTVVTHTILDSPRPVTTTSNGTITANSAVVDTVGKTISFNVTGNTNDTAFIYIDFPKNVINVTSDEVSRWNVTFNGATAQPQITQNATDTFMFGYVTFSSDVTVEVEGDNIIPELSSVLIMLMIASFIVVAVAKSRSKKLL